MAETSPTHLTSTSRGEPGMHAGVRALAECSECRLPVMHRPGTALLLKTEQEPGCRGEVCEGPPGIARGRPASPEHVFRRGWPCSSLKLRCRVGTSPTGDTPYQQEALDRIWDSAVASGHPLPATPLIGHGPPTVQPFPRHEGPYQVNGLYAPAGSLPPLRKGRRIIQAPSLAPIHVTPLLGTVASSNVPRCTGFG